MQLLGPKLVFFWRALTGEVYLRPPFYIELFRQRGGTSCLQNFGRSIRRLGIRQSRLDGLADMVKLIPTELLRCELKQTYLALANAPHHRTKHEITTDPAPLEVSMSWLNSVETTFSHRGTLQRPLVDHYLVFDRPVPPARQAEMISEVKLSSVYIGM